MPALRNAPKPPARAIRLGSRILKGAAAAGGGGQPSVRSSSTYASAASDTTFNLALPSGWQAGDVCYIAVEARGTGATIGTPAGFTAVAPTFNAVGVTNTAGAVFRRVLQAGDTDPVTITGASARFAAVALAVQGADSTTPEDGVTPAEDAQSAATNSPAADSVTPTGASDLLLCFFGAGDPVTANVAMTFTQPAGMTLVAQVSTAQAAATDAGMMAASLALSSNAATGTQTATITPSSGTTACNSQTVALVVKPPGGGGGGPAGTVVFAAPLLRRGPHRASLGARGALAAGILAVGIGPPAVAAPHQPPSIAHPAPHRALWRSGKGVPPGAAQQVKTPVPVLVYARKPHGAIWRRGAGQPPGTAQQVKVPATVYARKPHGASWRGGRGSVPAALPQPFRPPVIAHPAPHRALWRGGTGVATVTVQGTGAPQPFRPPTVYARKPHAAAWRSGQGAPPAARPQPSRPTTVYTRGAHRALWRAITGPPPAVVQAGGTPQPFRPATVYRRAPHGAIWKAAAGRPPAAAAQPFKPATVYRRVPHAAAWRAITGRPPAATRQPRAPATVFTRAAHRSLWRRGLGSPAAPPPPFTVGALSGSTAPTATLGAADKPTNALTATTAPSSTITAGTSRTGGPS